MFMAIIYIPKSLIQKIIEDEEYKMILRMRGNLADTWIMTDLEIYRKYISINNKG